MNIHPHSISTKENSEAVQELLASVRSQEKAEASVSQELPAAINQLVKAIRNNSGTSPRIAAIIWSLWNGDHVVGLCDCLASLDAPNGSAILTIIKARLVLSGDADPAIRQILTESGEMDLYYQAQKETPDTKPVPYPLPLSRPERLRELAEFIDPQVKSNNFNPKENHLAENF